MCTEGRDKGQGARDKASRHGLPFLVPYRRSAPSLPLAPARGFSLIEAVLFIVVVGIALAAVVNAFSLANRAGADPVLRRQSLAIAQALLEEISHKDFANPAGGYAGPYNATTRPLFDDVMDYHGLTLNGITDLAGAALSGLEGYRAAVLVAAVAFGNVPAGAGWRITVTVTDPSGQSLSLDGYRADY